MRFNEDGLKDMVRQSVRDVLWRAGVGFTEKVKQEVDEKVDALLKPGICKAWMSGDENPRSGFKNIADFAHSVFKAEMKLKTGSGSIDSRLVTKTVGSPAAHESEPEYGGYLIPQEFRATLLETALNNSNVFKTAMMVPMATSSIAIPFISGFDRSGGLTFGGISFNWVEEEGQLTGVRPKLGQVGMRLRKISAMAYVSNEMLEDSPITLEPLFSRMFSEGLTWALDNVAFNGTGVGMPLGILNAPALITVNKEDAQSADTIIYENVLKMYSRMWRKSSGVWYANDDVLPALGTMSLAVGTGGAPVYIPAGGAAARPYDSLLGKPLFFTEHCRTLGDAGDLLFCDFSQYLLGQKAAGTAGGPYKFDTSLHLKFDFDQTAFRLTARLDGAPWWSSALTPRYSQQTLSPFVALEAR